MGYGQGRSPFFLLWLAFELFNSRYNQTSKIYSESLVPKNALKKAKQKYFINPTAVLSGDNK